MKRLHIVFLGLISFAVSGCGTPANHSSQSSSSSLPKPAPTVEALLDLDRQANEAYIKADAKFFEGLLHDKFVMYDGGRRVDKAGVIRMVGGNKCDVKDWKLDDPRLARIDADTYVLSYRGTFAGSCAGADGKSMKVPSPVRAATVWVRGGEKWQAAFHGQNPLIDPKDPPPAKAAAKPKAPKVVADSTKPADADTAAMMQVEKSLWEAWMAKDRKRIEDLTAPQLVFQNIFGTYFASREEAVKDWTGPHCDVTKVGVTDGAGALLSPTVGLLTRTGTAEGTCGGQKISAVPIYGASVFVKQGGAWKLAFTLNQL